MFNVVKTYFLCHFVLSNHFFRKNLETNEQNIFLSLSLSSVCEELRSLAKG